MDEKKKSSYKTREDLANENKELKSKVRKSENDVAQLTSDMIELKTMLQQVLSQNNNINSNEIKKENIIVGKIIDETEYKEVSPTKRIKVISLTDGILNLSTGQNGLPYRFPHFGFSQTITYSDLEKIIVYCNSFAHKGAFYVCDDTAVANNGLADVYKNILDLDGMKNLFKKSEQEVRDIFSQLTPFQQEVIVNILRMKLAKKEPVDMNKIHVISQIVGRDITEQVYTEDDNE